MGLSRGPQERRHGRGVGNLLWGGMLVAATVFGVLAGPKIVADQHELMCGWSSGWQRFAGLFTDCAVYAHAKGPDPIANAKRRIEGAGYKATNADFIRAVARRETEVVGALQELGIRGDEQSLREELLRTSVSSGEFNHLAAFMSAAHSQHYAARPREELKAFISEMRTKKSAALARDAACRQPTASGSFAERFAHSNLAPVCADEGRWIANVVAFSKKVLGSFKDETQVWWGVSAISEISYVPSSAEKISLQDLKAMPQEMNRPAKYVQVDGSFSLVLDSNTYWVEVFVTPTYSRDFRFPTRAATMRECVDDDPKRDEYFREQLLRQTHKAQPPRPKCRGTLVFLASNPQWWVMELKEVRALSAGAGR